MDRKRVGVVLCGDLLRWTGDLNLIVMNAFFGKRELKLCPENPSLLITWLQSLTCNLLTILHQQKFDSFAGEPLLGNSDINGLSGVCIARLIGQHISNGHVAYTRGISDRHRIDRNIEIFCGVDRMAATCDDPVRDEDGSNSFVILILQMLHHFVNIGDDLVKQQVQTVRRLNLTSDLVEPQCCRVQFCSAEVLQNSAIGIRSRVVLARDAHTFTVIQVDRDCRLMVLYLLLFTKWIEKEQNQNDQRCCSESGEGPPGSSGDGGEVGVAPP